MLWTVLLVMGAAVYGACAGMLVPRAAYRLGVEPEEEWRRECPEGHPLRGAAFGWLGRARCAGCVPGTPPYGPGALRYACVTAAVCALLAAVCGRRPELAVWLLAVPFAVLLAAVDWRVQRLPDVLTLPLAAGVTVLLGVAALLPGAGGGWARALVGGAVLGGAYFVLFLINPRGLGFGDVKLAVALGVALGWYGWQVLFVAAFLGFLLAAGYGVALMLAGRAGRGTAIPLGPFMVLGGLGGVLLGGLTV